MFLTGILLAQVVLAIARPPGSADQTERNFASRVLLVAFSRENPFERSTAQTSSHDALWVVSGTTSSSPKEDSKTFYPRYHHLLVTHAP